MPLALLVTSHTCCLSPLLISKITISLLCFQAAKLRREPTLTQWARAVDFSVTDTVTDSVTDSVTENGNAIYFSSSGSSGDGLSKEAAFASALQQADSAKSAMVMANLRLVVSLAQRYRGGSSGGRQAAPLGDLVQEGILGLVRSCMR